MTAQQPSAPAASDTPATTLVAVTLSAGAPSVTVSVATNCRTGPGLAYPIVSALGIGQAAQVIGQDTPDDYWVIENPYGNGICWLWGQYAIVSGDTSAEPETTPPPTPLPTATPQVKAPTNTPTLKPTHTSTPTLKPPLTAPAAPTDLKITIGCKTKSGITTMTIKLTWTDVATDEKGYKIYSGSPSTLLATQGANSTSYSYEFQLNHVVVLTGQNVKFTVEAYNSAGAGKRDKSIPFACP